MLVVTKYQTETTGDQMDLLWLRAGRAKFMAISPRGGGQIIRPAGVHCKGILYHRVQEAEKWV